jgi:imidazolonepropionase-like amidohydrolase
MVMDRPRRSTRTAVTLAPRATLHLRGVVLPSGEQQDVFVHDGRVTFTEQPDATTVVDGAWLVPGLVDAHAHLALASPAGDDAAEDDRIRASLAAHLDAGVLLVREPGSPTRAAKGLGPDSGCPRVVTAGHFLAPPGRYFPGLARMVDDSELADAAEDEARHSGAWVKIVGDFRDDAGRFSANYSTEAITEAVARAHAAGARLAVHVMSRAGMDAVVEAGVDTIEHGHGMTDEHIAVMARLGTTYVPTMSILHLLPALLPSMGLVQAQVDESMAAVARHPEMVGRAADAGLSILAGTDAGMVQHGTVRNEVQLLLDAGLPTQQAVGAASWAARAYLGLPGIEEGAPADIVAFATDPREDPSALGQPSLRILDGRVVAPA